MYRTYTLKISRETFVFLSSLENIISDLPSHRKVVILHKFPQNPESLLPYTPTPSQASTSEERGATPKYVQSQGKQHNCPMTKRSTFLDVLIWAAGGEFYVTHTELTEPLGRMNLEKSIYFWCVFPFLSRNIKVNALTWEFISRYGCSCGLRPKGEKVTYFDPSHVMKWDRSWGTRLGLGLLCDFGRVI